MSGSSPIKSPRNLGIDALRGFAAIAVMLYHFVGYFKISGVEPQFGKWIVDIASHGKLGVIVFFVLSGYVIAMTSQQVKFSFASSLRFLARRLTRLIPPYWALIVGLTILYAAAKSAGYLANSQLTIAQVLANLFYLQGLAEAVPMSPVFWTLCIEVQFYLVFASLRSVIAIAFNGRGATPTTAIFALSMAASVAWRASVPRDDIWFMGYWYQFAFGILAYRLASSPRFRAFPTLLILSASLFVGPDSDDTAATSITGFTLFCLGRFRVGTRWLRWTGLPSVGTISYSLYLTHSTIAGTAYYPIQSKVAVSETTVWIFICTAIFVSLLSSAAMYHIVERTAIRWSRRIATDKTSAVSLPSPN